MTEPQAESKGFLPPPSYGEATGSDKNYSSGVLPIEVITHLKLLFSFAKLREAVMTDVTLFGLDDSWLVDARDSSGAISKVRQLVAEKRWDIYVRRAAVRFERWWASLQRRIKGRPITIQDLICRVPLQLDYPPDDKKTIIGAQNLPPLDVLMVWHSFLLSPRRYLEDCLLQGMMPLWRSAFPWAAIDQAIDPLLETGTYDPQEEAILAFLEVAPWANVDDVNCFNTITCPHCHQSNLQVSCTTFDTTLRYLEKQFAASSLSSESLLEKIEAGLRDAHGWADPGFKARCASCLAPTDRQVLCAQKLKNDIMRFWSYYRSSDCQTVTQLYSIRPMPGTVLNARTGLPQTCDTSNMKLCLRTYEFFPNILAGALCHVDYAGTPNQKIDFRCDMAELRQTISSFLSNKDQMLYASGKSQSRANKHQRPMVRRMMASYNDNPSPFTMDLASAVHRQGSFIQKMQQIDWVHSPALSLTADRVITKYQRFMMIIAHHTKEMAVPTLDVDLAWHTHQLSPTSYARYTTDKTGKFVDHDDKVSEHKLSESFARTSKHYQRLFNEPYSECTCWYCEAIHASISSFPGRFILPGRVTGYRRPEHVADEQNSVHISSHNAVRMQHPVKEYYDKCQEHLRWLDKAFQRACDRAKKEGRPPPKRRHRAVPAGQDHHAYIGPDGMGGTGFGGKGMMLAAGAIGVGVLAVGAIAIAADGYSLDFGGHTEVVDDHPSAGGGGGGCVAATCGGGVGWGGCSNDGGGVSGACGGSGSSCSGGDGGGGCGGCGGCGG